MGFGVWLVVEKDDAIGNLLKAADKIEVAGDAKDDLADLRLVSYLYPSLGGGASAGVWGRRPHAATLLRRSRPGVWGRVPLPAYMIQSSQPVFSAVESSNLTESSFGGWAVRARVAIPNGPRVSAAKPRTAAHPAKLDSDKMWRRNSETKQVA